MMEKKSMKLQHIHQTSNGNVEVLLSKWTWLLYIVLFVLRLFNSRETIICRTPFNQITNIPNHKSSLKPFEFSITDLNCTLANNCYFHITAFWKNVWFCLEFFRINCFSWKTFVWNSNSYIECQSDKISWILLAHF